MKLNCWVLCCKSKHRKSKKSSSIHCFPKKVKRQCILRIWRNLGSYLKVKVTRTQQWTLAFNNLPTHVNSVTQYAGQYVNLIWNINVHLRQAWMVKPTYCGFHGAGALVTSDNWAANFQLGALLSLFGNSIVQSCSSSRFYKCNLLILLQGFFTLRKMYPLFCSLSFYTVHLWEKVSGPYANTRHHIKYGHNAKLTLHFSWGLVLTLSISPEENDRHAIVFSSHAVGLTCCRGRPQ